ncbi:flagellar biosynthetic protein FliR [Virgisporangium ochraceum]|jgi:flagellar biosynthetic protein FliR|uniref:Flagellar biosynthetic protein FliR n=1 Tax=Virgisporangium ochraceum TaxID=65505 RepID=A0A8J4EBX3_9ACTN|nr:flagellar biosynthetic protein FliR [Virgisporangium ochraceum]GIJ69850.1 flagellar biosynthetic protein FliR [Virgisporangium ochraceum]
MNLGVAEDLLIAVLLASVRALAWMMAVPPFNSRQIPARVKALVSVAIALPVAPALVASAPSTADMGAFVRATAEQVVVGAALGFITALFFAAVQAAGSMIDLFGSFSVASAFDPFSGTANAVFGRFYNILATALLFATDGFAMVVRGFATSYRALPVGEVFSWEALARLLTTGMDQMFLAAMQIAGPLVAVLFCTDVALGLLTRVSPGLNVFSLAFPVKIGLTLLIASTALVLLPQAFNGLMERAVRAVVDLVGGT